MNPPAASPASPVARGRFLLAAKDFATAYAAFDEALRESPRDAELLLGRGKALAGLGEHERAIDDFTRALDERPDDGLILVARARSLLARGDREACRRDGAAAIPGLMTLVRTQFANGHFVGAAQNCDVALWFASDHAEALAYRGACRLREDDHDRGHDDLVRALALDATNAFAWEHYGRALLAEDDHDGALAALDESTRLDPRHAPAFFARGDLWEARGDRERALLEYERGLASRPDPAALARRAAWWAERGEIERAEADYRQAIRLAPDDASLARACADLLASRGDYDEAFRLEERSREIEAATERAAEAEDAMNPATADRMSLHDEIVAHFSGEALEALDVVERAFPRLVVADLQSALDRLGEAGFEIVRFQAVNQQNDSPPKNFAALYTRDRRHPPRAVAPAYFELDVGEESPVRCLRHGLWLLRLDGVALAALYFVDTSSAAIHAAAPIGPKGREAVRRFFAVIEDAVARSPAYRGKILSLDFADSYDGYGYGIRVHRLRSVPREQVILPAATLELLERNVTRFVAQRA